MVESTTSFQTSGSLSLGDSLLVEEESLQQRRANWIYCSNLSFEADGRLSIPTTSSVPTHVGTLNTMESPKNSWSSLKHGLLLFGTVVLLGLGYTACTWRSSFLGLEHKYAQQQLAMEDTIQRLERELSFSVDWQQKYAQQQATAQATIERLEEIVKDLDHTSARGSEHRLDGLKFHNKGNALYHRGRYDEALKQYQEALAIKLKAYGPVHPETGETYHAMGNTFFSQGKHREATTNYQASLAIKLQAFGLEHPDTGATYHAMGNVLYRQGKYLEAMTEYQTALAIKLKAHGPEHRETGATYHAMGNVFVTQGKNEQAMKHLQKARRIFERVLGPQHEWTKDTAERVTMLNSKT